MTEKTLTAGELAGVTGLTPKTIRQYVRDFRKAFSAEAGKKKTGRRYMIDDVKKILTIRHMRQARKDKDFILLVLEGKAKLDNAPWLEFSDALTIAQTGLHALELAEKYTRQNIDAGNRMEIIASHSLSQMETFRKIIKEQDERLTRMENFFKLDRLRRKQETFNQFDKAKETRSRMDKFVDRLLG